MVVSYNTRDLLDACLASMAREIAAAGLRAGVHVVDNASTDGSAEMVADRHPGVRLTAVNENLGYAGAINLALREWLDGDLAPPAVLVSNADVELLPGSVSELTAALNRLANADDEGADGTLAGDGRSVDETRRSVAVVGPALTYPDGRFQHAAFHDPGVIQTLLDLFPVPRLADTPLNGRYPRSLYAAGVPFPVDFPLGACLMVALPAVREVGLLDEGYFMYCEEIDWCRRFRDRGYGVLCAPRARVVHHAGASTNQFRTEMRVALWRSRLRFFRLHESRWRSRLLSTIVRLGLRPGLSA